MACTVVTGGSGFIGSNIVHALVSAGQQVRVLDNLSTGRAVNLVDVRPHIEFIEGDVRDIGTVRKAVKGARFVLHLAALPSVEGSVHDPLGSDGINLRGTLNVLEASREAGVERVVFSSSSSIYGDDPELPKRETMRPAPLSPYAVQKLAGETYGCIYDRLYGIRAVGLRYFNVYGPRQNPHSHYAAVIPLFMAAYRGGRQPTIYGDGGQTRDFVYVEDVVRANLAACTAVLPAGVPVVCNVAGGQAITVNELAARIAGIAGQPCEPVHKPERPGDVRHSVAAIEEARLRLGWTPTVSLEDGLRRTYAWFAHENG